MAITWRFTGTAANAIDGAGGIGGGIVPTLGGTTSAGDLKLIAVVQRNGIDYTAIASAGYTPLYGKNNAVGTTVALLGAIAGDGDADPTVTTTDTTSGRSIIAQAAVFTGTLDTVTGIIAHSISDENSNAQTDIDISALTVTTDGTLVVYVAGKGNDFQTENAIIGASDALTELGQPERTTSAQVGMVWAYRVQTTAATVTPGNVTLTANAATGVSIGVSILPAAVAGHPAARRFGRKIIGVEGVRIY